MERRITPQERYEKKNIKTITVKLNRKYDADILIELERSGNKQGFIKAAIREKIKKGE